MNNIKTVADKIRSMNDEELAELLSQIGYESYKNGLDHAVRFKKRMVSYEMMFKANKTLLSESADEVDSGPLPGMGL
jgi:hypothetical protein